MHAGVVVIEPAVIVITGLLFEVALLAIDNIVDIDNDEVAAIFSLLLVTQPDCMADLVHDRADTEAARSFVQTGMPDVVRAVANVNNVHSILEPRDSWGRLALLDDGWELAAARVKTVIEF